MAVHLAAGSSSQVSLPSGLDSPSLSGSALSSALRQEPPTAQTGRNGVPCALRMEENREVPSWFHSARARPLILVLFLSFGFETLSLLPPPTRHCDYRCVPLCRASALPLKYSFLFLSNLKKHMSLPAPDPPCSGYDYPLPNYHGDGPSLQVLRRETISWLTKTSQAWCGSFTVGNEGKFRHFLFLTHSMG